jgi:hypothetical protein
MANQAPQFMLNGSGLSYLTIISGYAPSSRRSYGEWLSWHERDLTKVAERPASRLPLARIILPDRRAEQRHKKKGKACDYKGHTFHHEHVAVVNEPI